jgi:hypothetical protein
MKNFKKFLLKVKLFLLNLFDRTHRIAAKVVPAAVDVVELLKYFMDSPADEILTALIPGGIDDVIAAQIKKFLPEILVKLKIASECATLTDREAIIQCAIKHLQAYSPDARHAMYLNIASLLAHNLSKDSNGGEKLSWSEVVHLVQFYYTNKNN